MLKPNKSLNLDNNKDVIPLINKPNDDEIKNP